MPAGKTRASNNWIPFQVINAADLPYLPSLLREWFPTGKRDGKEWRVATINGEAGESFSVNMRTGKWKEFAGGKGGGDVISLYAAKFCHGDNGEAARQLASKFGIEIGPRKRSKPKGKVNPGPDPETKGEPEWVPMVPPPGDVELPDDAALSRYDTVHRYTSIDGPETHFVGRIEARGDERKKFIPITYGEFKGVRGWHEKAPDPPRPLYGLCKLTVMPNAAVILCEGEKAADAAQRLFSDHACLSWFGGVGQVEHADLSPLANRKVTVWPDADAPGLNAARKLIPRLPAGTQVVRTDGLPGGFDAYDLEREGCNDPAAWLNARLITAAEFVGDEPPEDDAATLVIGPGFFFNKGGLWFRPDENEPALWVCAPLEIVARTSDDTHCGHGLLLQWTDADNEKHKWAMPLRLVHAEGGAIAGELHHAGLRCGTSRKAHDHLKQFLGAATLARHVRCVDRAGWHDAVYVLPNGLTFGAGADNIVLQTERATASGAYAARGTLDDWRSNIARYAVGNTLLTYAISSSFGGPLLDILDVQSGGEHFYGSSRIGKTTLLRGAVSVWGPADGKLMRTWRVTANGLEAVAAETNDGLLALDEIKQANAREVGDIIYTLASGIGKARANRAGGARPSHAWRTSFQSTGEITLAEKLAEANLRQYAGQDVRMVQLSADAGAGIGVWQNLHSFSSGAALADHLRKATRIYCGTAGSAYLDQLARERASDRAALTATLRMLRQRFLDEHVPSDADGQVCSVAERFALNAAAGELATAYEITGWPEDEAYRAAGACFKRWLEARGGTGAAEEMEAVKRVRAFIAAHGSSRFELADSTDQKIINRAGWKLRTDGADEGWDYLVTPDCWKDEICRGFNAKLTAGALAKAGFLVPGSGGRRTFQRRIKPHGPMRGYLVRGAILGGTTMASDTLRRLAARFGSTFIGPGGYSGYSGYSLEKSGFSCTQSASARGYSGYRPDPAVPAVPTSENAVGTAKDVKSLDVPGVPAESDKGENAARSAVQPDPPSPYEPEADAVLAARRRTLPSLPSPAFVKSQQGTAINNEGRACCSPSSDTTALHPAQSYNTKYLPSVEVSIRSNLDEEISIDRTESDGTVNSSAQGSMIKVTGASLRFWKVYFIA